MNGNTPIHSAIYSGWVKHCRYFPKPHKFNYRVFMMYLDIDELPFVFDKSFLWSFGRKNIAEFRCADYLDGSTSSAVELKSAILEKVEHATGKTVAGRVCMLTNLRYFGYIINPLTVYYCFDTAERLQAMVLEVTNTPWKKRHTYVLSCDGTNNRQTIEFDKSMHVSPFHGMDMIYQLVAETPKERLNFSLRNKSSSKNNRIEFDAGLSLQRQEITQAALTGKLIRYPFMTLKVCISIYWQALRLLIKKMPLYPNVSVSR